MVLLVDLEGKAFSEKVCPNLWLVVEDVRVQGGTCVSADGGLLTKCYHPQPALNPLTHTHARAPRLDQPPSRAAAAAG